MKFTINKKILEEEIKKFSGVIGNNTIIPILENIYINAQNDKLILRGTNLSIGLEIVIEEVNIISSGNVTIPYRTLVELIRATKVDTMEFSLDVSTMSINIVTGTSQIDIKCMDADEYPPVVNDLENKLFSIESNDLKDALEKVVFCALDDSTRPVLQSINIKINDEKVTFESTDGFRVGISTISKNLNTFKNKETLVMSQSLNALVKILNGDFVDVFANDDKILFSFDNINFVAQTTAGNYPNIDNIFPKEFSTKVAVTKEAILNILKQAYTIGRHSTNLIKIYIDKEKQIISFETKSEVIGRCSGLLDAVKVDGDDIEVAANISFLLDAIKRVDGDNVYIYIQSSVKPILIYGEKTEIDLDYIIMPMHYNG